MNCILAPLPWFRLFAALAILTALFTYIGPSDMAEDIRIEAEEKEARAQRARAYYRELLCDCLKTHGGKNLRLHIVHQPDRELCYAKCVYDDGTITKGTL